MAKGGAWRTDGIPREAYGNVADPCGLVKDVRAAQGGGMAFDDEERRGLEELQKKFRKRITVRAKPGFHQEQFEIIIS